MTGQARPLRVLDLGAHDGFVAAHLAREHQGPLHIDGIELHPRGVETMDRRLAELGVQGRCKQGNALDAEALFDTGSYDAVVLFELIEHVPDMDELLAVAERMLAPDGVIYVSTPDGCFGEGGNPHHLRALRAIDVAELLRRRGRLVDMGVGEDTITHAAYQPCDRSRGQAAIYTGPSWMRWHPRDIATRGLGGSETAAVHLADQLDQLGYVVTIYGDVEEGAFRNVVLRHHSAFDPLEPRALFISSRMPHVFDRPVNADRKMLWMHDVDCGPELTPERARQIDDVLVLSEWHEQHVAGAYPFLGFGAKPGGKIRRIRNGVDTARFQGKVGERRARVLYTSSPDRGLDVLLELWPQVRKLARQQGVKAELAACYSPVYWRVAEQDPVVGAHAARVRELADQPGVTLLESQPQPQLARLMRESLVWCAPSYNTPHDQPFHETSCIGAMEAQAAGCYVVASNWGALAETVQVGARVDGPPLSRDWSRAFVGEIVRGLTDPKIQEWAQSEGPKVAATLGWDGVAAMVDMLVDGDRYLDDSFERIKAA